MSKENNHKIHVKRTKSISGWVADQTGVNSGGWGLTLSVTDMAKIGQLYLNGGMWNGKHIVSLQWVEESTKEHSHWDKLNLSYGYLWWVDGNGYSAMGDGGNAIYVNTNNKSVVAIISLYKPNAKDRIEFIKKYIEPVLEI